MARLDPQPGDIVLSRISGATGFLIALGQLLVGDASRYTHAGVVVEDGNVVEAEPGGARLGSVQYYLENKAVFATGRIPLTEEQRQKIVDEATSLVGTPYSFVEYLAIGLHRFGLRLGCIDRYITDSGHMICSQLVDEVYRRAGVHLFNDGRLPQDVTPGDIANVLIEEW